MADPKIVKARQRQKTDTTANWEKAANFVPLKGEIIVYQDSGVAPKFKIGDGTSTVGDLKFVSGGLTLEDIDATLTKSGKAADAKAAGDGINSLGIRVTTTEEDIENINQNVSTLQNQANTNSNNISSLQEQVNTNSDDISTLWDQTSTNTDNVSSLQDQANANSNNIYSLQEQVYINSGSISSLQNQSQNYATKTYVQEEISKAELGGGGDIDVSGLATKQDLADLIDDSLKESGKAADAKVVGERFDSLDTIIAVDENSDGNIVLRPYLPEDGESDGDKDKVDVENGVALDLTVKGSLFLVPHEGEPGVYIYSEYDQDQDRLKLALYNSDSIGVVAINNIASPVHQYDAVNKQYADSNYAPADHTHDYPIDATLTKSGWAADAAATGEALAGKVSRKDIIDITHGGTGADTAARAMESLGITAALAGKAPVALGAPHNYLDNSDFRNPVNQRGKTTYNSGGYCIDRWYSAAWNAAYPTVAVESGGIHLTGGATGANTCSFEQAIEAKGLCGKTLTIAVKYNSFIQSDESVATLFAFCDGVRVAIAKVATSSKNLLLKTFTVPENTEKITIYIGNSSNNAGRGTYDAVLEWAALYEGEYTAETLPEYKPKGYGVELAECMRYYQAFLTRLRYLPGDSTYTTCYPISFMVPMRITPTVTMTHMVENVNGIEAISSFGATIHVVGQSGDGTLGAQFSADL